LSAFAREKLSACPCIVVRRWAVWLRSSDRSTRETRWPSVAQRIFPTAPALFLALAIMNLPSIPSRKFMRQLLLFIAAVMLAFGVATHAESAGEGSNLLTQVQTIRLEGVEGRIDHFGSDAKGKRLFVSALGNNTVEVVDLAAGRVTQHIRNLRAPQGIGFAPESNRLAVANDRDGSCRLYDGTSLQQTAIIELKDDADNVRYDNASRRFWVGYGDGGLAAIDPESGRQIADVKLDAHPESFQLEKKGKRIFVNVPNAGHVAVVDSETGTVIEKIPLNEAHANFPMALDEGDHRLFIGCRSPAKLLVLDTETDKTVASLDIVGDTDDLFYDAANKRIYVSGGEGRVTVISQTNADRYNVAGQVTTAPGARTSFFVRETGTLYVAVPHLGEQKAELRVFTVAPSN
jgi:DNA-binding beta-propeller fold protein YncE